MTLTTQHHTTTACQKIACFNHTQRNFGDAGTTISECVQAAGRNVVQVTLATAVVALPIVAIASGMGAFSSGQNTGIQNATFIHRNDPETSRAIASSSTCAQSLALGMLGTLVTNSIWPFFASLFGCVPGADAQTPPSLGSGSSSSNPVLNCNNEAILSYTVGQAPIVVDSSVTVGDLSTNGLLAQLDVDTYIPDTLSYKPVEGLSVVEKRDPASMANGVFSVTVTPNGPKGSLASVEDFQQFLRSITFSSPGGQTSSVLGHVVIFNVFDADASSAACSYRVAVASGSGSGSGQTPAPTPAPGSGSGSGQTPAPTTTPGSNSGSGQTPAPTSAPTMPQPSITGTCLNQPLSANGLPVQIVNQVSVTDAHQAINALVSSGNSCGIFSLLSNCFTPTSPATVSFPNFGASAVLLPNGSPLSDSDVATFFDCITYQWNCPALQPSRFDNEIHFGFGGQTYLVCAFPQSTSAPPPTPASGSAPNVPSTTPNSNHAAIIGGAAAGGAVVILSVGGVLYYFKCKKKQSTPITIGSRPPVVAAATDYKPFNELHNEQTSPREAATTDQISP